MTVTINIIHILSNVVVVLVPSVSSNLSLVKKMLHFIYKFLYQVSHFIFVSQADPGLASRFDSKQAFYFADYSDEQLLQIMAKKCRDEQVYLFIYLFIYFVYLFLLFIYYLKCFLFYFIVVFVSYFFCICFLFIYSFVFIYFFHLFIHLISFFLCVCFLLLLLFPLYSAIL